MRSEEQNSSASSVFPAERRTRPDALTLPRRDFDRSPLRAQIARSIDHEDIRIRGAESFCHIPTAYVTAESDISNERINLLRVRQMSQCFLSAFGLKYATVGAAQVLYEILTQELFVFDNENGQGGAIDVHRHDPPSSPGRYGRYIGTLSYNMVNSAGKQTFPRNLQKRTIHWK